jgi:hypothetical protein
VGARNFGFAPLFFVSHFEYLGFETKHSGPHIRRTGAVVVAGQDVCPDRLAGEADDGLGASLDHDQLF